MFTPEDFGVLGTYSSIVAVLSILATLRFEVSLPIEMKKEFAVNLVALSIIIMMIILLLYSSFIVLFTNTLLVWFEKSKIEKILFFIPVGVFLGGLHQLFYNWLIRGKEFGYIAKSKYSKSIIGASTQLISGLYHYSYLGLIMGQILGVLSSVIVLIMHSWVEIKALITFISIDGIKSAGKKHWRFPIFLSFSSFIRTLSGRMPLILIASFFGIESAGYYALSTRLIQTPMNIFGQSLLQVFYSRVSDAFKNNILNIETKNLFRFLTNVGLPILTIIAYTSPNVIALIFGEVWRASGEYIQIFSPWYSIVFITAPITVILNIMNKQHYQLIFQIFLLFGTIAGLTTGYILNDLKYGLVWLSIISTVIWFLYMLQIIKISRNGVGESILYIIKTIIRSFIFILPIILVDVTHNFLNAQIYIPIYFISICLSSVIISIWLIKVFRELR